MEYNLKKDSLKCRQTLYDSSAEQAIETQISLPEYCKDVERILKCFIIPNIHTCRITGDRVTAEGEAVVRVIYVSSIGNIECYEQATPFSKYIEVGDLNNECCALATANSEYVNCRAISSRKLSVDGNISVHFSVSSMTDIGVVASADGCGIQTKKEAYNTDLPVASCRKIFEIGETVAIDQDSPPIASIIRTDAFLKNQSVKCIANKMLIKGDISVDLLYKADNDSDKLASLSHTMPMSQIIEMVGIDENSLCDCVVNILCISFSLKSDSNGENRLIDLSVRLSVCSDAYENKDAVFITDAYSTEYEVECENKSVELLKHLNTYNETKNVRATVDTSGLNIAEVMDVCCRKVESSALPEENIIKGRASVLAGILYKDADGSYGYTERTVDFNFDCQGKDNESEIIALPSTSVHNMSASTIGTDKTEISFSASIYMPVIQRFNIRIATNITPDETKPKPQNSTTLTVYFASQGETLWNIARSYNTTVEAIKEENELATETVGENMMLMLPRA